MDIKTLAKIDKALEFIELCHLYIITTVGVVIASPFILVYQGIMCINHKIRGMVYDPIRKEWITRDEHEKDKQKKSIENREIPINAENHKPTDKNDRFMFFEKRNLKMPYDQLVYVESEYNEEIHRFFTENAEWLEMWQRWHGWDIVEYDAEEIKEGMFYPDDYVVFKHGFLWRSHMSSWDKESGIFGNIHHYFELDITSEKTIKDQMECMMRKIYDVID